MGFEPQMSGIDSNGIPFQKQLLQRLERPKPHFGLRARLMEMNAQLPAACIRFQLLAVRCSLSLQLRIGSAECAKNSLLDLLEISCTFTVGLNSSVGIQGERGVI